MAKRAPCEAQEAAANRHFTAALSLLDRGEIDAAISEFEEAMRVRPHFAVLYDLGLAYGLAGRPVEAADTLRRYLDEGAGRIDEQRRAQVSSALRFYEGLIGTLVVTAPAGSSVTLDGKAIPTDVPVRVRAGRHGLVALRDARPLSSQSAEVPAGKTTTVTLEAAGAGDPTAPELAWLSVRCEVPDVELAIDEHAPAVLRDEPLPLTSSRHRLVFSRPGYDSHEVSVDASPHELVRVNCGLEPRANLAPNAGAALAIRVDPATASISVDGSPYQGQRVPFGRHYVGVAEAGSDPWSGVVVVQSEGSVPAAITLQPTAHALRERGARARRMRTWAYVTAGAGTTLAVVASGLFIAQADDMSEWRSDRATLSRELAQAPATPDQRRQAGELAQRAAGIQQMGDAALALAVAGGALIATSIGLFIAAAGTHATVQPSTRAFRFPLPSASF